MRYYAFEYWSGRKTTTGKPNHTTGRLSIAGTLKLFSTRAERDRWVAAGRVTSDMQGNCRKTVTVRQARSLHQGMSIAAYNDMIELLS